MSRPWLDVPEVWKDEQAFLNWMRSQTRRIWSRHPIKTEYVKRRRISIKHAIELDVEFGHCYHPRTKWVARCEKCDKWWACGRMEVDHIHGGTGFDSYESFLLWQKRMLFVDFGDIQHLCKPCHHRITMSQKFGCTEKEVDFYLDRAAFRKLNAKQQKAALKALELECGKNSTERLAIYEQYLRGKHNVSE